VTGLLTAIPYVIGVIGLVLWGHSSDRRDERRWHLIIASTVAAAGLAGVGWFTGSYWALVAMSIATIGIYGSRPSFWPMPSMFLTGASAAAGIALINSIGNLHRRLDQGQHEEFRDGVVLPGGVRVCFCSDHVFRDQGNTRDDEAGLIDHARLPGGFMKTKCLPLHGLAWKRKAMSK
jgi:hypothetical protein